MAADYFVWAIWIANLARFGYEEKTWLHMIGEYHFWTLRYGILGHDHISFFFWILVLHIGKKFPSFWYNSFTGKLYINRGHYKGSSRSYRGGLGRTPSSFWIFQMLQKDQLAAIVMAWLKFDFDYFCFDWC